jgi:hypothetical protein
MPSQASVQRQEEEWMALYRLILKVLARFGRNGIERDDDYFVVDENIVWDQHKVEVSNLALLRPEIIHSLQRLLAGFPGWGIVVGLSVPDGSGVERNMGLSIRSGEIIDGLQRQFLPEPYRDFRYEGLGQRR